MSSFTHGSNVANVGDTWLHRFISQSLGVERVSNEHYTARAIPQEFVAPIDHKLISNLASLPVPMPCFRFPSFHH